MIFTTASETMVSLGHCLGKKDVRLKFSVEDIISFVAPGAMEKVYCNPA